METLMIVIVLMFNPQPDGKVGISYEAKLGVKSSLQACQAVAKAFDDAPQTNKKVIVLCAESKKPTGTPSKREGKQVEA